MANTKTTGLTELTAPALSDLLYIVDDPGGTPLSKKITLNNLLALPAGMLYTRHGVGTQTPGLTYVKITQFDSEGPSQGGVSVSAANNEITVTDTGLYVAFLQASFAGSSNSTVDMIVFWNGSEVSQAHFSRKLGSGGDIGSASAMGIVDVTTGNTIFDVRTHCDGVSDTVDVDSIQFFVCKIGPT